jgi:hypothetical protein
LPLWGHDPLDEIALAGEEHDDHRDGGDDQAGDDELILAGSAAGRAVLAEQLEQPER